MRPKARHPLLSIDRALLLALLLVAAASFAFLKLASEVAEGDTMAFDRAILAALRTPADPAVPIGPAWLAIAMRDATALGGPALLALVIALVAGHLLVARKVRTALFVVAATGVGMLLGGLLKLVYQRPRPDLVPHLVDVATTSFPSGHAADSAIVYLTLAILLARTIPDRPGRLYIVGTAIALTLLIGASRVFLGVHWPSDVIGGWILGAGWALLCSFLYRRAIK